MVPAQDPFPPPAGWPVNHGWHSVPFSAGTAVDWFVALGHSLYVTNNVGRTWSLIPLPSSKASYFVSLDFVSANFGWASTYPHPTVRTPRPFLQTTDGGKSWTVLSQ